MASENSSGSQYALTALGVGMLALGIIMMVWSVVPGFGKDNATSGGNSSSPTAEESKTKVSQVSYILCAGGVVLLLLSICLSVREKRRRRTQEGVHNAPCESTMLPDNAPDLSEQLAVPSYNEVMQGESSQPRGDAEATLGDQTMAALPSYESLVDVGVVLPTTGVAGPSATAQPGNGQTSSRPGRRFSSKRIRRILSDKSHLKNFRLHLSNLNSTVVNLEPLTPPPQYEDGVEKSFENLKPS
ncbi:transmembrane protein 51a [Chiloscyllium plagiosum]|uniref:transmembrane protein 51a n=1 Tax=Chiloscyllium plagiosum TaxID=36176 RepID=UPI001CB7D466|nr:transmembrane protein 51a [Chiloscyllium plagiosum]XP_043531599.1 transmembrane protein 51a [Chiloscyllium plagiosum]